MSFQVYISDCRQRINSCLEAINYNDCPPRLASAMQQALLNGGKRIRPLLVYAGARCMQVTESEYYLDNSDYLDNAAMAIEMIHAYSLVHDDLPAMDDDDLRRGMPTIHKAFDEATAILCGDALLTMAFEQLSLSSKQPYIAESIQLLAQCAGKAGMVGGQQLDMDATDNNTIDIDQLATIHRMKTGALIKASLLLGALPNKQKSLQDFTQLERYASHIGKLYQIRDDILDVESTTEALGKPQGSDAQQNKTTYVSLLGLEQAKQARDSEAEQALQCLNSFDESAEPLRQLVNYLLQ